MIKLFTNQSEVEAHANFNFLIFLTDVDLFHLAFAGLILNHRIFPVMELFSLLLLNLNVELDSGNHIAFALRCNTNKHLCSFM